ncbi:receptor-binding protein [Boe paramyxovirus]|nr:receptor-binding protein [Boe paramyxovirus]
MKKEDYQYYTSADPNKKTMQMIDQLNLSYVASVITSVASLISLIVLIAVNISTLVKNNEQNNYLNEGKIDDVYQKLSVHSSDQAELIIPQISIINRQVSFQLPVQLASMQKDIVNDIAKICSPLYETNLTMCPVVLNPVHSPFFSLATPTLLENCFNNKTLPQLPENLSFSEFPSFIPGPTRPGGCSRTPSFSLSGSLFSYTHNIIEDKCKTTSHSSEFMALGVIVTGNNNSPKLENIKTWHLDDNLNRKHCTTVAKMNGAWFACNIVDSGELDDYATEGISKIYLSYRDIFGTTREWIYVSDEIQKDYGYNALYFGVGSGVIKDGKVYFLMYGGLSEYIDEDAYCHAPGCENPEQQICNQAQQPEQYNSCQMVNALLEFDDRITYKPRLKIITFSPSNVRFGSEGRLYGFPDEESIYIYLKSSSWHSLLQVGKFQLSNKPVIDWTVHYFMSRPGSDPCKANNRCPKSCVTGVYCDFYPFNTNYSLGISGYLRSQFDTINPWIRMASSTSLIAQSQLSSDNQKASYSTTTCFIYNRDLWCLTIFEFSPATIGEYQPVPFLYKVTTNCWKSGN